jgi:hypothetical protein
MCRNYREVIKNTVSREKEMVLHEHLEKILENYTNNEPHCYKKKVPYIL